MQVEDHEGYIATDKWTRWLPEYDEYSYQAKVVLCKTALRYWGDNLSHATRRRMAVKTSIAKDRWDKRERWCQANVWRWRNTLREAMIGEGMLYGEKVPF